MRLLGFIALTVALAGTTQAQSKYLANELSIYSSKVSLFLVNSQLLLNPSRELASWLTIGLVHIFYNAQGTMYAKELAEERVPDS